MKKLVLLSLVVITFGLQAGENAPQSPTNKSTKEVSSWLSSLSRTAGKAVVPALVLNAAYQWHGGIRSSDFKLMAGAAAAAGVFYGYKNGGLQLQEMGASLRQLKNVAVVGGMTAGVAYFFGNASIPSSWKTVGVVALSTLPLFGGNASKSAKQ